MQRSQFRTSFPLPAGKASATLVAGPRKKEREREREKREREREREGERERAAPLASVLRAG